jgi:hypothetical protein
MHALVFIAIREHLIIEYNMLDIIKEATDLVERMKTGLPIFAYPTKSLRISMSNNKNIKLKSKSLLEIKDVLYMGDEGGIGCVISFNDSKELLVVSVTHLRIKDRHPLLKEIKEYQYKRKRALSRQN